MTCFAVAVRNDEAKAHLAEAAAICAGKGMNRYLLDGGEHLTALVVALRNDRPDRPLARGLSVCSRGALEAMAAAVEQPSPLS